MSKAASELNNASPLFREEYVQFLEQYSKKLKAWLQKSLGGVEISSVTSITLGSGLSPLKDSIEKKGELSFTEVGLPQSSTLGHGGKFIAGFLNEKPVLLQAGRLHCYEGFSGAIAALPARLQAIAGIQTFIITNAAGALDPQFIIGDIIVLSGNDGSLAPSPSIGLHGPLIGSQFYSVTDPYDQELRIRFFRAGKELQVRSHLHSGSYKYMPGPRYEERTEIAQLFLMRMQMLARPDIAPYALAAVGMSTVPEVYALNQLKTAPQYESIRILGLSLITNHCAGIASINPTHEEVIEAGNKSSGRFISLISSFLKTL